MSQYKKGPSIMAYHWRSFWDIFTLKGLRRVCSGTTMKISVKSMVSQYSRLWVEWQTNDGPTASCRGTTAWWDGWLLHSQTWKASVGECVGPRVCLWVFGLFFFRHRQVQMIFFPFATYTNNESTKSVISIFHSYLIDYNAVWLKKSWIIGTLLMQC